MKQHRIIFLLLCVTLLCTFLLIGCSSNGTNSSYDKPDSDSSAQHSNTNNSYDEPDSDYFAQYGDDSFDTTIEAPDTTALAAERNRSSNWDVTYTDFSQEDANTLIGYGYVDASYNDFFDLKGNTTTYWVYDYEASAWVVEREFQDYYGILTRNIEGSFKIHNGTSSRIHVRNQTETSMEVRDSSTDEEWVKVDLITAGNTVSGYLLEGGQLLKLTYIGYLPDGEEVTVELSEYNDLQITVKYQYEMFDSWGYWETFTPGN